MKPNVTTVGVRELKSKLSEYLERAKRGEQIIVTEHGKKVAMLSPLPSEQVLLDELVGEGYARWNGSKPKGLRGVNLQGQPLSDTVLADRE